MTPFALTPTEAPTETPTMAPELEPEAPTEEPEMAPEMELDPGEVIMFGEQRAVELRDRRLVYILRL